MARVIRADRNGPAVLRAEVFDAKVGATAILERAEREAEALRARAHIDGYAAGRADAAKQLFDLNQLQHALAQRTEQQALQAVLLVAAELLGSSLNVEPDRIVALLAPHLTRMRRARMLVMRLHPDDATWLETHAEGLNALCEQSQLEGRLELRHDPTLTRGGCLIETNLGEIDARVETRLTLLAAALGLEEANAAAPITADSEESARR